MYDHVARWGSLHLLGSSLRRDLHRAWKSFRLRSGRRGDGCSLTLECPFLSTEIASAAFPLTVSVCVSSGGVVVFKQNVTGSGLVATIHSVMGIDRMPQYLVAMLLR
jgi:hypothetical protein